MSRMLLPHTRRVGNRRNTASRVRFTILWVSKYAHQDVAHDPPTTPRLTGISDRLSLRKQQRQRQAHTMTPRTLEPENHRQEMNAAWLGSCLQPELVAKNVVNKARFHSRVFIPSLFIMTRPSVLPSPRETHNCLPCNVKTLAFFRTLNTANHNMFLSGKAICLKINLMSKSVNKFNLRLMNHCQCKNVRNKN
ncbi:hypothetical protein NDU88_008137 [Pleurodeles waltl]|uniref:Uncharacterized protein n=1 Tax=Pleurodeles waltl TaxID=8319 RepID=A0AAV7PR09_PLEWA|nr:hypothetical protein NDU88_008137 [Pleurodeles waltl]